MPSAIVDSKFAGWVESATVGISEERLAAWRSGVGALAKGLTRERCLQLVEAAFGEATDGATEWVAEVVREHDDAFVGTGKERLIALLAGAAIIEVLQNPRHARRMLACLLVQSAHLTLTTPSVPEMISLAAAVNRSVRNQVRARGEIPALISAQSVANVDAASKPDPEVVPDLESVAALAQQQGELLTEIAEQAAQIQQKLNRTVELQDEELDILWWSFGGSSTSLGIVWSDVAPPESVAVVAAMELRGLVKHSPAPASARALFARALGENVGSNVSIGEVAKQLVEHLDALEGLPEHRLTPIYSAAKQISLVGADDDTWKTVVKRTLGYDVDDQVELLDAADQVLRELDLRDTW